MTNGLTKLAQPRFIPGVPARPAIPAIAERWYLSPAPPGWFYVFTDGEWRLRVNTAPPASKPGYSIPISPDAPMPGFSFPSGARITFNYAPKYGDPPTYAESYLVPSSGQFYYPPNSGDLVLVRIDVVPAASTTDPSQVVSPQPPNTTTVRFTGPMKSNGYPTTSANLIYGEIDVPTVDGGYVVLRRQYARSEPSGIFLPTDTTGDPPYFTTFSTGVRASLLSGFPGAPGVAGSPSRTEFFSSKAWDAGANSFAEIDGDLYVKFAGPEAVGAYVGLFEGGARTANDYGKLFAAFRFALSPTGRVWSLVDDGRAVTITNAVYSTSTQFEIRRISGAVVFLVDGAVVYRSKRASYGPLRVGTTLYATGDKVL